mmetsp:Transcript_21548/g.34553  ORF Transcript_21548/g.34553 Transcript_21548/m.34553 type:complete len:677 (-) Transcript_21548:192-2222(-)
MATEADPAELEQLQHQAQHQKELKEKKKRKKKKDKKKHKKSVGGNPPSRTARNHQSFGAPRDHYRRESIPHHATVQSLASINQPAVVNKLTKMSQDLKLTRELQKALMELKQKDEDYRYAIEIGESLQKENQYLKEQIELLESQVTTEQTDNDILKEKLETLSQTYHQDLYKYHQDLQAHKELVNELTASLNNKEQELVSQQKALNNNQRIMAQQQQQNDNMNSSQRYPMERMTSDDIQNLNSNDLRSSLEKQLFLKLQEEERKHVKAQETIENLMKKMDDMMEVKKKYETLKKEYKELKRLSKDELQKHIQMQKAIETEAIYLAARTANLEEERQDLLNLIDQRDYELTMLNQQLALQRRAGGSPKGNEEATLGDDIPDQEGSQDGYYQYDEQQGMSDDESEIEMIADILENEDIFDENDDDEDGDEDEEGGDTPLTAQMKQQQPKSTNASAAASPTSKASAGGGGEAKKDEPKQSRDQRAFDKIKEYLHLTASAVKIKYPTIKSIQSDELIKKVKELPFYKYHDQMVRIMETEIKKIERQKSMLQTKPEDGNGSQPTMQRRRSFLDIFNFFGGDKGAESDEESVLDETKSDISDSEQRGDESITERRSRRPSGSRKRRKSKKKRRKKSLDADASSRKKSDAKDQAAPPDSGNEVRSVPRGMSVQASQKRLRQMQ